MGAATWAVPVGVLAAICGAMFFFVLWWFPRTWQKGVNAEARAIEGADTELDDEERKVARAANWARSRAIVERALAAEQARKRGEVVEVAPPAYDEHGVPIKPAGYSAV